MSFVIAAPDLMAAAATNLATINSSLSEAHAVAASPTSALLPAAADEVSAGIAKLFAAHAEEYQGVAGEAAAFHERFVQQLSTGAIKYGSAEAGNAAAMDPLGEIGNVVNAFLGFVFLPVNLAVKAFNDAIYTLILQPLYSIFIAPVVNALVRAIIEAIFVGFRSSTTTTTSPSP